MSGVERVGVVGCGLMGSGIAEVCARADVDVVVAELDAQALAAGRRRVLASLVGVLHDFDKAEEAAQETGERFGVALHGVSGKNRELLRESLARADVVLTCAAAGIQVVAAEDLPFAPRLKVAADVTETRLEMAISATRPRYCAGPDK